VPYTFKELAVWQSRWTRPNQHTEGKPTVQIEFVKKRKMRKKKCKGNFAFNVDFESPMGAVT